MAPRTKKQKELGIIGKKNRSKKETPMLESIQSTRRLEQAAMKGEKVSPKLNTTLADIVRVKRGSKYKGQGNVPTLEQEKERAKLAKNAPVKKAMGGVMKARGGTFKGTY